jgi:hypothetical protein
MKKGLLTVSVLSRIVLIIFFITLVTLFGGFIYFYQTMTVGDTKGLIENLENLKGVVRIENYRVYEGNAFFSLALSGGGYLSLGGVGNADIVESDGIIVEGIGSNNIACSKDGSTIRTTGVSIDAIQHQYLSDKDLSSIQKIINNYHYIDQLFSKMPLTFKSLIVLSEKSNDSNWTCMRK